MKVYFLEAQQSLTKSFTLEPNGTITKSNYPKAYLFTSHEELCPTLSDFYKAVVSHAKLGHCLLKGELHAPLIKQSRANSTKTDGLTQWICLDWDKARFASPREALDSIVVGTEQPFKDIAHIVQYSASQGINGSTLLNCHIFIKLSKPIHAPYLKAWLTYLNLKCKALNDTLTLNELATHISWPLDISTCQNDKLIYIAPPVLKDVPCTLKESDRYQLIKAKGDLDALPVERIANITLEKARNLAHERKNELRVADGWDKQRLIKPKLDGAEYILVNPGTAVITGMRESEEYVHFNLNGGDSWSYWHPADNFNYIHCFKHPDEKFRTAELLPDYFRRKESERIALNASPTEQGELIMTFSNKADGAYFRGSWNAKLFELKINQVKTVKHLDDWRLQHGRTPDEFTPTWDMYFDPQDPTVVDVERKKLNLFVTPPQLRRKHAAGSLSKLPRIMHTLKHAISGGEHDDLLEHFLNWVAVIYQKRIKTKTAWVTSGTYGTGKSVIGDLMIQPTLTPQYATYRTGASLEEGYNGWMEDKLFVFFDEVDLSESKMQKRIQEKLKSWVTQDRITIRHMYRMEHEARNYTNFIFASNSKEPLAIKNNDRRYNIGVFQPEPLGYKTREINEIKAELDWFVDYMMTRKIDVQQAHTIIENAARTELIQSSRSSIDVIAEAILQGDFMTLFREQSDTDRIAEHGTIQSSALHGHHEEIMKREAALLRNEGTVLGDCVRVESKLSRDELQTIFECSIGDLPSSPTKFTQFLRHRGITVGPVWIGQKTVRGVETRWYVSKTELKELEAWLQPTPVLVSSTTKKSAVSKARVQVVR
jgi:hypothetical protein